MQPHRGTMILVFGILSLFICGPIFGPMAWIMGNGDLEKMRQGIMDPSGEQLTNVGKILGMIGTILAVILIVGYCLLFVVIGSAGFMTQPQ
ncbi:MAG: DUF4190 domain-containing protein [Gemmataceae bacterium]